MSSPSAAIWFLECPYCHGEALRFTGEPWGPLTKDKAADDTLVTEEGLIACKACRLMLPPIAGVLPASDYLVPPVDWSKLVKLVPN